MQEEWNYKLLSIKSSHGNDNYFTNEEFNIQIDGNQNDSASIEVLEKSPEMTVYISEKDLSPANQASNNRSNLKTRFEYLWEKSLSESQEFNNLWDTKILSASIIEEEKSKNENENNQENILSKSDQISQEKLINKLMLLKEPEINYTALLTRRSNIQENKRNLSEHNEQISQLVNNIWEVMLNEGNLIVIKNKNLLMLSIISFYFSILFSW